MPNGRPVGDMNEAKAFILSGHYITHKSPWKLELEIGVCAMPFGVI
jgi:hypothetical protein